MCARASEARLGEYTARIATEYMIAALLHTPLVTGPLRPSTLSIMKLAFSSGCEQYTDCCPDEPPAAAAAAAATM